MRTKNSFRKIENQTKENIDKNCELYFKSPITTQRLILDRKRYENFLTKMENNFNTTFTSVLVDAHDEEEQVPNSKISDLLIQGNKSKQKQVHDNYILSDISNKSNEFEISSFEDINTTNEVLTGMTSFIFKRIMIHSCV